MIPICVNLCCLEIDQTGQSFCHPLDSGIMAYGAIFMFFLVSFNFLKNKYNELFNQKSTSLKEKKVTEEKGILVFVIGAHRCLQ